MSTATTVLKGTTFKEHMTKPLAAPPWVIEPIIAEGDRTVTYAQWGAFKTYWLLHLAVSLALGRSTLGGFRVPQVRKVVYIDEEMSQWALQLRIQRLAAGMGITPAAAPDIPLITISRPGLLLTPDGGKALADYCAQNGLKRGDQVFYDSLRRGLVGSENDQEAVSRLWAATLPLSRAGLNIHFSHHMPKPQGTKASKHVASGSTDILVRASAHRDHQDRSIVITRIGRS